ncbi:acyl-CoA synthetase (NDP forming) [Neobacillus niacini]|uniref:acetate--CoA ligase family protein n=1 Tax=Neobacillus niacini TaxID=86668 RepID=UPI002787F240|nr:CoA-binding protein [Neobacillus niacini]MDQ1002219.1 acyl-CoA synthetase (NDP forming) [Neobacillus niacini]
MSNYSVINKLINPKSIAIVGASNNTNKHGGRIIAHLLKHHYPGEIYPINPKETEIQGFTCYKSLDEVPFNIDLVCFLISPNYLMDGLRSCANKKIKMVMIHSSGFAEIGEDGAQIQKEIVQYASENGIRICGPNTIGVANVNNHVFASFSMSMMTDVVPMNGTISYITQSGAVGGAMLSQGWEKHIGINNWISSGNEADLDTADFIDYLAEDKMTKTICVFLEGVKDGRRFIDALAHAANQKKPLVMYKNGRSEVSQKSVQSHTGVLAGNYDVYEAVFNQFGVINAVDLDDLFDYAIALDSLTHIKGKGVGVISSSGGACTLITDNCIKHGLEVPDITNVSKQKLMDIVPDFSTPQNPFDTTAQILSDPDSFKQSLKILIDDSNLDVIVVMLTTLGGDLASKIADDIIELSKKTKKPIIVAWTIAESLAKEGMDKLRKAKVPLYPSGERAIKALAATVKYSSFQSEWEKKKDNYNACLFSEKIITI